MSPELREALLDWKQSEPEFEVYEFARRAHYLGAWIGHSGWYPDRQRRLYRRNTARFSGIIHESLRFTGKPGRLGGDIFHYTIELVCRAQRQGGTLQHACGTTDA